MTDAEKQEFAVEVFTALVGEKQDRLARGAILRQAMHDTIERGEQPQGYRPKWLREKSLELVRILGQWAEEFDAQHPTDAISNMDLLDVVATTASLLSDDDEE